MEGEARALPSAHRPEELFSASCDLSQTGAVGWLVWCGKPLLPLRSRTALSLPLRCPPVLSPGASFGPGLPDFGKEGRPALETERILNKPTPCGQVNRLRAPRPTARPAVLLPKAAAFTWPQVCLSFGLSVWLAS